MFRELRNQPRPYAWGDSSSIARWQNRQSSGEPEAELWLGTHPGSEAQVIGTIGNAQPLTRWLTDHGHSAELPFLVKLLAAAQPLSIQVHPSKDQAALGFARENQQGIGLDHPARNYRDDSDKPEILIAWSEEFHALVGFQDSEQVAITVGEITNAVTESAISEPLNNAVARGPVALAGWLFSGGSGVAHLTSALEQAWSGDRGSAPEVWQRVATHFPGDPGLVAALFLNHVSLKRGEALFVPPGIPHAYMQGFGLEVMAPSDNVLRGGLTPKHVDRAELLAILKPEPFGSATITSLPESVGCETFAPPGVSFEVRQLSGTTVSMQLSQSGPVVVVVESGEFHDESDDTLLGGKAYIGVGNHESLSLKGSGSLFVVSSV